MTVLKAAIQELQSSLAREQEFNASSRRLNAEYLVNVLRSFLMSDDHSERAQLVSIIAQLLHFRVDESKAIAEKWAVKPKVHPGGLVGWFMPKAPATAVPIPTSSSSSGGSASTTLQLTNGNDSNNKNNSMDDFDTMGGFS